MNLQSNMYFLVANTKIHLQSTNVILVERPKFLCSKNGPCGRNAKFICTRKRFLFFWLPKRDFGQNIPRNKGVNLDFRYPVFIFYLNASRIPPGRIVGILLGWGSLLSWLFGFVFWIVWIVLTICIALDFGLDCLDCLALIVWICFQTVWIVLIVCMAS